MAVDATQLVNELDDYFAMDPNIDEYDLIPFVGNQEKKNILVTEDHKLAINAYNIPTFYTFAYQVILKFPRPIDTDNIVVDGKRFNAVSYSRAVLLVNPETATAWNIRKELIVANALCAKEDLKFSKLILNKHPKSQETWIHRRWLLKHLYLQKPLKQVDATVISEEFAVCTRAADKYHSNYNAWSHRLWVLNNLVSDRLDEVLHHELLGNKTWVNKHISDHSGLHYRGALLQKDHIRIMHHGTLMQEDHIRIKHHEWFHILLQETSLVSELILCYPEHEALWYYRRRIVHLLFKNCEFVDTSLLKSWAVDCKIWSTDDHQSTSTDDDFLKREVCKNKMCVSIEEHLVNSSNDSPNTVQPSQNKETSNSNNDILEEHINQCKEKSNENSPKQIFEGQTSQSEYPSLNSQQILFEIEEQLLRKFECNKMNKDSFYLKYRRWLMNSDSKIN